MLSKRPLVTIDTECYKNYWLFKVRHLQSGKTKSFELYEGHPLDIDAIKNILRRYCVIGFNLLEYDIPIIALALSGASNARLKAGSDAIIVSKMKYWDFYDAFEIERLRYVDMIDLMQVAPGQASLKLYGGRMHSIKLQDLPIEPSATIKPEQRKPLRLYCGNDLQTNIDLFGALKNKLDLRVNLGKEYGLDLRSKSDAQIAEAVIRSGVEKLLGKKISKRKEAVIPFKYKPPEFIQFSTPAMQRLLSKIKSLTFQMNEKGKVALPEALENFDIKIGDGTYRLALGGLHSQEANVSHVADENTLLIDRDVASYYPMIILICKLFPKHIGPIFLKVLRAIVVKRLSAKKAGQDAKANNQDATIFEVIAESLKIVVNSCFGKFGEKHSYLFSPELMIQTTITGQLALLMLIESMELNGIPVVSANTDGIVMKCPVDKKDRCDFLMGAWEFETGFTTEETQYRAVYSQSVNHYIAIKTNGEVKRKGDFSKAGLAKNPTGEIATDAVIEYLLNGTPLDQTIGNCTDIRKFFVVRTVAGGAIAFEKDILPAKGTIAFKKQVLLSLGYVEHNGCWYENGEISDFLALNLNGAYVQEVEKSLIAKSRYCGKVVRWYYSTNSSAPLRYKTKNKFGSHNKVADSDNSRAMMELVEGLPEDLDLERYREIANKMLIDLGAIPKPEKVLTERQIAARVRKMVKDLDLELEKCA